ncbi:hypothetical protein CWC22_000340 [Pseudoalteromonas rubra]|uniref:Tox-REase-7 domain-containing protein n=2 Tax=Pseudoalteromonas rubra TaxID=43658 RepID=A0A5S3UQJ5_9GAMM|nr:hypothetical protein CWC22_000340 [Pseudoalteromonas rubra]
MNGRIYDADTGRFMQADPFVQAPSNLQNYNAYSYVLNNPLSYTDPSGYLFKKLTQIAGFMSGGIVGAVMAHQIQRFIANSKTLSTLYTAGAAIVSGAVCGPCSIAVTAYASAQNTYYQTGDFGAAIKAGALSGASATAFFAVGGAFEGVNTAFGSAGYFGKVAAHGLVGGTMSVMQGGKFGHGFAAAGFTQALAPAISRIQPGVKVSPVRVAVAALVGGTVSKISGGKFANGAVTAAFSRMFNDDLHDGLYPFSKEAQMDESHPIPDEILELYEQYQEGKFKSLVGVNKAAGESAEEYVASIMRERGYIVLVKGVTLKVNGKIRYPDLTLLDGKTEELVSFMEVKLNNSRLIARQIRNDRMIQTEGAIVTRTPSPTFLPLGKIGKTNVELFRIYYQDQD